MRELEPMNRKIIMKYKLPIKWSKLQQALTLTRLKIIIIVNPHKEFLNLQSMSLSICSHSLFLLIETFIQQPGKWKTSKKVHWMKNYFSNCPMIPTRNQNKSHCSRIKALENSYRSLQIMKAWVILKLTINLDINQ